MRRVYFSVMYVLLAATALLVAGGAPIPWSGTGGGGGGILSTLTSLGL